MSLVPFQGVLIATGITAASVFEGIDVVKILQVGATGFALLMLYLGYSMVKTVVDQTPTDTKGAQDAYRRKVYLAYAFLAISLLFAAVGLTGQLFLHAQTNEVLVVVTPADFLRPKVWLVHGVVQLKLNDVGRTAVLLGHKDELTFDMTKFVGEQRALITGAAQARVANSAEGGFDEPQ